MSQSEAHSFTINVAQNGKFLFRTDEDNAVRRNQVLAAITKAFPASEGFEVSIVDWPARAGAYTIIHKPDKIACKGGMPPDDPKEAAASEANARRLQG